jgi:hypothetical protein
MKGKKFKNKLKMIFKSTAIKKFLGKKILWLLNTIGKALFKIKFPNSFNQKEIHALWAIKITLTVVLRFMLLQFYLQIRSVMIR